MEFLIRDRERGRLVPIRRDPRLNGFVGEVHEIAHWLVGDVFDWPDGRSRPELTLGFSAALPPVAQVFRDQASCKKAGYTPQNETVFFGDAFETLADYQDYLTKLRVSPVNGPVK